MRASPPFPFSLFSYPFLPSINVFLPWWRTKRRTESFVEHVLLRKWICAGKRMCVCLRLSEICCGKIREKWGGEM